MPPAGGAAAPSGTNSSSSGPSSRFLLEPPLVKANACRSLLASTPGTKRSAAASVSESFGASSATPATATPPIEGQPAIGSGTSDSGAPGTDANNPVVVANDENEQPQQPAKKRAKKCASDVWQYFTKKTVIIEDNGKQYEQLWAECNFPNCRTKYRAESFKGTTGFWTHLRTAHSVVKGQQQLSVGKDQEKDLTVVKPFS
ncbi:hypothetical protein ACP70R_015739 [Stipagrostis hirtigluma subsp. patula]